MTNWKKEYDKVRSLFHYFSCPDCSSHWFLMYGAILPDDQAHLEQLECKGCGWHGLRSEGESMRFFRKPRKYEPVQGATSGTVQALREQGEKP